MDEQNEQAKEASLIEEETLDLHEQDEIEERPSRRRRRRGERRYRFAPRKRERFPQLRYWREALLAILLLTAVVFLINPFTRLAQAQATVARPPEPLAVTPPQSPERGYCITGDFLGWNGSDTPLVDDGTNGDRTAGDGIYSRTLTFEEPERYLWRVLPCGNWDLAVPEISAWVFVTEPNQPVTFTFTPTMPPSNLWPRAYAFTASDTLPARMVAVGTFQNQRWDSEDPRTQMEPIGNGQFQLAYRVPLPGRYETYAAIQGRSEGIGASGRSREPIPLAFTTEFPSEMVVIQYDGRTDRIAVLYGMSYGLSWLGFGWGTGLIAAVAIVGSLILGTQIAYTRVVLHPERQYRAGCPNCQQHNLQRISRESKDYLLETIGIPVRRYKCRSCGWEGRRIQRNPHHP